MKRNQNSLPRCDAHVSRFANAEVIFGQELGVCALWARDEVRNLTYRIYTLGTHHGNY